MKYALHRLPIFIFLLVTLSSPVLSQTRARLRKPPTEKPEQPNHGPSTTSKSDNYTSAPFDVSLRTLPLNYLGHDPKAVWELLSKISGNTKKDEFETTEAYRNRIGSAQARPLTGDLTTASMLAFSSYAPDIEYNADRQVLEVVVRLEKDILGRDKPERFLSLDYQDKPGGSYVRQNAYGAKVVVEREYSDSWKLSFTNYASVGATKHREKPYDDSPLAIEPSLYDAFVKSFEMDVPTAKQAKQNLRLLVICKPTTPWASKETSYIEPTLQKPKAVLWTQHWLHVELLEIWYYDSVSGKVYEKQKRL